MNETTQHESESNFDQTVRNRLHAEDFAQPQVHDYAFYKNKAIQQISSAVNSILEATTYHEFTSAIAQANAFIDAAVDYEFLDIMEKAQWLTQVAHAMRVQRIDQSA